MSRDPKLLITLFITSYYDISCLAFPRSNLRDCRVYLANVRVLKFVEEPYATSSDDAVSFSFSKCCVKSPLLHCFHLLLKRILSSWSAPCCRNLRSSTAVKDRISSTRNPDVTVCWCKILDLRCKRSLEQEASNDDGRGDLSCPRCESIEVDFSAKPTLTEYHMAIKTTE